MKLQLGWIDVGSCVTGHNKVDLLDGLRFK
jgi:hypothetical protein